MFARQPPRALSLLRSRNYLCPCGPIRGKRIKLGSAELSITVREEEAHLHALPPAHVHQAPSILGDAVRPCKESRHLFLHLCGVLERVMSDFCRLVVRYVHDGCNGYG